MQSPVTTNNSSTARSPNDVRAPTQSRSPRSSLAVRRVSWAWLGLSSAAIAAFAVIPYLTDSLRELAEGQTGLAGLAPHYSTLPASVQVAFYVHIVFAGIALLIGPLQFWAGFRNRFRRAHQWIGRVYLVSVGIGGLASLVMAPFNSAGFVGFFGFGTVGVLWIYTAWKAYRAIRRRDVRSHQAWMMRNFALTYAAVTLRLWTGLLLAAQIPFVTGEFNFEAVFANAYAAVPFLSWLPNLIVAEFMIRRRGLPSFQLTDSSPVRSTSAHTEATLTRGAPSAL